MSLQQLKMKVAKLTQTKDTHSEMEYGQQLMVLVQVKTFKGEHLTSRTRSLQSIGIHLFPTIHFMPTHNHYTSNTITLQIMDGI
jgi:hypothetical protein